MFLACIDHILHRHVIPRVKHMASHLRHEQNIIDSWWKVERENDEIDQIYLHPFPLHLGWNHISAFDILDWYVQGYVWTSRAKKCPRFPIVPPPYNAYPPFPPPAARCGWGWLSRSSSLPCRLYSAECTAVQPTQLYSCTLHWEHKSNNRFPPHSTPPSS